MCSVIVWVAGRVLCTHDFGTDFPFDTLFGLYLIDANKFLGNGAFKTRIGHILHICRYIIFKQLFLDVTKCYIYPTRY